MNIAIKDQAADGHRAEVLADARAALDAVETLFAGGGDRARARRNLHTVKGAVAFLELPELAQSLHEIEGALESADGETAALAHLTRARAALASAQFAAASAAADRGGRPFADCLWWAGRMVDQLSVSLGKRVWLDVEGGDLVVDTRRHAALTAALQHLVRNAIVHGVEWPGDRERLGKPITGRIAIAARRDGDGLVVTVADDGAGLPEDLSERVFQPGVSGASDVSLYAGRGLGLDTVLAEMASVGGTADADSVPGSGATFTLRLPVRP